MDFGAANEKTHHIPNYVPLRIHFFSVAVMSYPTKCSVEKGLMWLPAPEGMESIMAGKT